MFPECADFRIELKRCERPVGAGFDQLAVEQPIVGGGRAALGQLGAVDRLDTPDRLGRQALDAPACREVAAGAGPIVKGVAHPAPFEVQQAHPLAVAHAIVGAGIAL